MPRPPQNVLYPMGDFNLILVPWCRLESLSVDGSLVKNARLVEIVPPELTNCVVFSDGKGNVIGTILGSDIQNVSVITQTKWRIPKKQDRLIEIVYEDQTSRKEHIAVLDIEERYITEFLLKTNVIISNVKDENYWTYHTLTFTSEAGQTKTVGLYVLAPFMAQEEEILWVNRVHDKQNKKLSWMQMITNYRIFEYNLHTHQGRALLYQGLDNVVVTNQRRTSKSNTVGTYVKSRSLGTDSANTNSTSMTLGDLVFISGGKPISTFSQISDPHGVARLVKSIRDNMASAQIDIQQEQEQSLSLVNGQTDQLPFVQDSPTNSRKEEMVPTLTEKVCLLCNRVNPQEARFCNGCGTKFSSDPICKSCGNSNPEGSSFCNKCGFTMA